MSKADRLNQAETGEVEAMPLETARGGRPTRFRKRGQYRAYRRTEFVLICSYTDLPWFVERFENDFAAIYPDGHCSDGFAYMFWPKG